MKRVTKELERAEIMFLDKMLPQVGSDAKSFLADPFGFSACMGKFGKRAEKNNIYFCGDCGAEFPLSEVKDYRKNPECRTNEWGWHSTRWTHLGTCPHCGRPMKIDSWRYKQRTFKDEVSVPATMGDWNITRYFAITSTYRAGKKPCVCIEDIGASWQKGDNTYHYIAQKGGMFYGRWWKSDTRHFANNGAEDVERVFEYTEHYDTPSFSIDAELARRGIDTDSLHGVKLTRLILAMQNIPHYETLWKQGNWAIAKHFGNELPNYWSQIRIALRHGYELNSQNLDEWRDMVKMLRDLGKDDHSPKYLCPADLNTAHQALVKQRDKAKWEKEFVRIGQEKCDEYEKRIERYLDLDIHDDELTIQVLPNIRAFFDEGSRLGHCVFTCGYYNKANSLLLSARQGGKRWETIEVDLVRFKILQCYGYGDKHTERHKEIIDLVNKNMWQIKERRLRKTEKGKKTKTKKVAVAA